MKKTFNRTFAGLGTALIAVVLAAYLSSLGKDPTPPESPPADTNIDQSTQRSVTTTGDGNTVIGDGNTNVNTGTIVIQTD